MPTTYTSLLGLALPVTGELSGTWGDTVNDYITQYLDASIAGALTVNADTTLTKTTGTSLGSTSSQYFTLIASGHSANITVTAPAASKTYMVINTSGTYTVRIRGAGPTTGVTLAANENAVVTWNGSDFVKVASSVVDGVSTISFGSTGLTPSTATSGAVTVAGTLATGNGGTGLTTFTAGNNAIYSTSASALTAGTLPVAAGGSGATSLTGIVKGNGTSAFTAAVSGTDYAPATSGTSILYGNNAGGFSNVTIGSGISFAGGTLSATGSGGTVTAVSVSTANGLAGTSSGGTTPALTLSTTVTGVVKGNGTALSAAVAGTDYLAPPSGTAIMKANSGGALANATPGTDYVAPGTATTFTATQTFQGSSSTLSAVMSDAAEPVTISATAATGTITYDTTTQSVLFYTTNATGNFTLNFRASSGTTLNALLSTGQAVTVVFLNTNGSTPYRNTSVQVDGTTSGVTTRWQGGSAPAAGNANSVDVYTYTIIKTGSATFSVFAAQTGFA
jgi:hypothetical protein